LGATGVIDPNDDDVVREGSATNWLLAARSAAIPSIVVGGLDGKLSPSIRRGQLKNGQWGVRWDVVLDIGACAVDWRGVYWADGA
jgi:hypothetical protein